MAAATSGVLQHHCARRAPPDQTHRLLGHLLTRPAWIAGTGRGRDGAGALHALALAAGQLAVVQPLLISGILFALPLERAARTAAAVGPGMDVGGHPRGRTGRIPPHGPPQPGPGLLDADVLAWATVSGLVVVGVLALLGMRWPHGPAPALLGTAAGIGYGVVAALLKETTTVAQSGLVNVLTDWPLYAMIGIGAASLALAQMAYRAGPLAHSMPALTITDPAASVALGAVAFQERLASGPLPLSTEVAGFVLMTFAAIQLARQVAVTV